MTDSYQQYQAKRRRQLGCLIALVLFGMGIVIVFLAKP